MLLEISEERLGTERRILLRCAATPYRMLLCRTSAAGITIWCKDCKGEHLVTWEHLRQLEAALGGPETCALPRSVLPSK